MTASSQTTLGVVAMTTLDACAPTPAASSPLGDLGPLSLRIAVGAAMLQADLIKALGVNTVVGFMESGDWRMPTFAATMVTAAETAGGILFIVGLLTPLAACAVVAAMIDAWAVLASGNAFWADPFNVPFLAAFSATALLFRGAGGFSLDARLFGRSRSPAAVTVALVVVAIAAAVVTWILLNGANPIHLTKPTAQNLPIGRNCHSVHNRGSKSS